ncbi:MAG: efflux RND transporter permease subunit [Pirellulales bacterium]|nr:efflux RND transporter permease subunit [Pirellulales bacterium]
MLNAIIRFSLRHQLLVAALALFLLGYGGWELTQLPIDLFPDLNRPRVTVMTEAPGLAPEEVETLITFPMETALNGATGVQAVRSSSGVGVSIVWVEFDWGTDPLDDRQIVTERLALVADRLPPGVKPQLAPISSITGQIMIVGMRSKSGKTSPMELRTLADWVVRQRLLTIEGVSQVFTIGGGRKQFQVLVDPDKLLDYEVSLHEVHTAVERSNGNVTGGYLDDQGAKELLIRSLGRVQSVDDLKKLTVKVRGGQPILLQQVARVVEGPEVKRGDSAAFVRGDDGRFVGGPVVLLTVNKQPGADTRKVTQEVLKALKDLQRTLPGDVAVYPDLYQQKAFIDLAIDNVVEALRDGSILVVIVLFVFLLNLRTTFITLTAIPLSVVITALVFRWFGLSINTMTLGGLAVAIGELVDDAIVDVENIFRRLRENRRRTDPLPPLQVVYQASVEVRKSIVFGTLIVVLVFIPLFGLGGMEGRLFAPLAVAYIVSILSSLLVSITVTPVLSYWLLPKAPAVARNAEGPLLRLLKSAAGRLIRGSLRAPRLVLLAGLPVLAGAGLILTQLESDFLPPFDEGVVQLNVILPPGTSLEKSKDAARQIEQRLQDIGGLQSFLSRTGRAELDEHAVGVNVTEIIGRFRPDSGRTREEVLDEIRRATAQVEGVVTTVEQPLAHLISHMLSGVQAQVAVKIYGDQLGVLRAKAQEMAVAVRGIDGVKDLLVEPQIIIPQLRIALDRDRLAYYGLTPGDVNELVETAMHGRVVSQVLVGQRTFDLLVRFDEPFRENLDVLKRLNVELPGGGATTLESVARIELAGGPNTIHREQVRRRIVLQCNVAGRGLVDVVREIQAAVRPIEQSLPAGYFVDFGGQFESQQSASRTIAVLLVVSLAGIFLVLYTMFRSANFALQVMAALPMAFLGAVAALVVTGQNLTVASMVGFISLCGIASRNGILLLNHYLHLVRNEGEGFSREMLVRAGRERLAPVLMTALTSGIGLVPLAMAAGEPGKEILYPIATVIIGGLISSTLLEFVVRPALFWTVGRKAGRRLVDQTQDDSALGF